jgi:hypothetical protein
MRQPAARAGWLANQAARNGRSRRVGQARRPPGGGRGDPRRQTGRSLKLGCCGR